MPNSIVRQSQVTALISTNEISLTSEKGDIICKFEPTNFFDGNELNIKRLKDFQSLLESSQVGDNILEYFLNCQFSEKNPKVLNYYFEFIKFFFNTLNHKSSNKVVISDSSIKLIGNIVEKFGTELSFFILDALIDFQGHVNVENKINFIYTKTERNNNNSIIGIANIEVNNGKHELFGIQDEIIVRDIEEKYDINFQPNELYVRDVRVYNLKNIPKGFFCIYDKPQFISQTAQDKYLSAKLTLERLVNKFGLSSKLQVSNSNKLPIYTTFANSIKYLQDTTIKILPKKEFKLLHEVSTTINSNDILAETREDAVVESINLYDTFPKWDESQKKALTVVHGEVVISDTLLAKKKVVGGIGLIEVKNANSGIVDLSKLKNGILQIILKKTGYIKPNTNCKIESVVANDYIVLKGKCANISLPLKLHGLVGEQSYLVHVLQSFDDIKRKDLSALDNHSLVIYLGNVNSSILFDLIRLGFTNIVIPTIDINTLNNINSISEPFTLFTLYGFGQKDLDSRTKDSLLKFDMKYANIIGSKLKVLI
ncbi:hypothetical protein IPJ91_00740 [bacterium]|nr:MAG: hypothetical protein IPJ91_00740 [bacterium]